MKDSIKSAPVEVGEVLAGKYRVERVLGVGGMGVVVAAMHLHLDKMVALKFMLEEVCLDAEVAARFAREAKAAARLRTQYINKVLDVGTLENGAPYMVMEFLEGSDLKKLMKERKAKGHGPLPVVQAVDYILQACLGMAEAHLHGFVHRDLKPPNLFLTRGADGLPLIKILDFGIAKASNDGIDTSTQTVMGSPLYMPPEQWEGARFVDKRGDIWALGAILHFLLSGRAPFRGESIPVLFNNVATKEPASLDVPGLGVPTGLQAVIRRCLSKAQQDRPQSVVELAELLAPFGSKDAAEYARKARLVGGAPAADSAPARASSSFAEETAGANPAQEPSQHVSGSELVSTPAPSKSRSWLPFAGVVGIAAGIIAIGVLSSGSGSPEVESAPAPEAVELNVASQPEEPALAVVTMTFATDPAGAEVRINGVLKGVSPIDIELDEGTEVALRFDLDGYEFFEQELVVRSDAAKQRVPLIPVASASVPDAAPPLAPDAAAVVAAPPSDAGVTRAAKPTRRATRRSEFENEDGNGEVDIEVLVERGEEAVRETQYGKGGKACRQVLERDPKNQRALMVCAIAACNLKQSASAKRYIKRIQSKERRGGLHQICMRLGVRGL